MLGRNVDSLARELKDDAAVDDESGHHVAFTLPDDRAAALVSAYVSRGLLRRAVCDPKRNVSRTSPSWA
jgi:hypothetical protein